MSFILESIKQAERERKLGQQQAPEISIEYSGAHIEDIGHNKTRWLILLIGLTVSAIIVWTAAYYLTSKDKHLDQQLFINTMQDEVSVKTALNDKETIIATATDQNIQQKHLLNPINNLHTSDLKSVKLIEKEDEASAIKAASKVVQTKQSVKKETAHQSNTDAAHQKDAIAKRSQEKTSQEESSIEKTIASATKKLAIGADKQELVKIYADLAALENDEPSMLDEKSSLERDKEQQVQIKTANYVVPEVSVLPTQSKESVKLRDDSSYRKQHEQAISSGVPSFGELPYDVQERVPDFNVSVHMFHADPRQRRIRINGQMYTEGKSLQRDLALVEITRYGAVFEFQGNLFRFNVR